MEIVDFMKKSRFSGSRGSSSAKAKPVKATKLHNYFNNQIMISLVNTEFSIEDSEVSVS